MTDLLPLALKKQDIGFRLLRVEIQNHHVLARNGQICNLELYNSDIDSFQPISQIPYSTVIIGPNGIGKSFILSAIAEIFRFIFRIQRTGTVTNDDIGFRFAVQYFMNGHCYRVSCLTNDVASNNKQREETSFFSCWEDGHRCGLHVCPLPSCVVASSVTVSDRFKTPKKPDGMYWYMGIRNENSPGTTGTKTLVRKTVSAIAECLSQDESFRDNLTKLLDDLGLEQKLEIVYSIRYKKVYLSHPMTERRLVGIFDNWKPYFEEAGSRRTSAPWGHKKFPEIRNNASNIKLIVNYLNKVQAITECGKNNRICYNIDDTSLAEDWKAIQMLSELDVMMYPSIRVYKRISKDGETDSFLFEESSSGETNMLCQFINILSRIEHHGLILIDEPETSSHPNWQVMYINWLNSIFERFNTCHFIISTHSHFLLTDLEQNSSAIVALTRGDDGRIVNIGKGMNTYCWSTDDILYNVFKVRNTRNRAFEDEMVRLYKLMLENTPENHQEIESIIKRFEGLVLRGDDPLLDLLNKAKDYVKS